MPYYRKGERPVEPPPVEPYTHRHDLQRAEWSHRPGVGVRYYGDEEVEFWCCFAIDCHQAPWPCLPARLFATLRNPPTT